MDKYNKTLPAEENDPTADLRKRDHIELAFQSQVADHELDRRFYYEPLLAAHPTVAAGWQEFPFLGKTLQTPMWVSSMTGGTQWARTINRNLAQACCEFGMGMGLGSCRSLLCSNAYFEDFNVRSIIGQQLPLYANLGVAQVEQLLAKNEYKRIPDLLHRLRADGLIIHVNPLQEWMQPEGDRFQKPPIKTIAAVLDQAEFPLIVKEVGQGFGLESLRQLLQLPLAAVDFGAAGGTNFALLELLRSDPEKQQAYQVLANVGHTADEMVSFVNTLTAELGAALQCRQIIISGGIRSFLDGYYLMNKLTLPSIFGQASAFLKHARAPYEDLQRYVKNQIEGINLAKAYLRIRP